MLRYLVYSEKKDPKSDKTSLSNFESDFSVSLNCFFLKELFLYFFYLFI